LSNSKKKVALENMFASSKSKTFELVCNRGSGGGNLGVSPLGPMLERHPAVEDPNPGFRALFENPHK